MERKKEGKEEKQHKMWGSITHCTCFPQPLSSVTFRLVIHTIQIVVSYKKVFP